jgi:hypothetical protein
MNYIEQALAEHWGEVCPEHEDGCVVCAAWAQYHRIVKYEELLTNLLTAIAKDRNAMSIMATKKEMAEAVAAMKHLWI